MTLRDWTPGSDWAVWIGIRVVVAYYDGSYTVFDRATEKAHYHGGDKAAMLASAYKLQDTEAMGQAFETTYVGWPIA